MGAGWARVPPEFYMGGPKHLMSPAKIVDHDEIVVIGCVFQD